MNARDEAVLAPGICSDGERFGAVVGDLLEAILFLSEDGAIECASPSTVQVLGCTPDELIGKKLRELIAHEDADVIDAVLRDVRIEAGRSVPFTGRFAKDGTSRWLRGVCNNLLSRPGVSAVVVHCIDVTETKARDERRRLQSNALEASAHAIVITDRQGRIEWLNSAFSTMTGYSPEELIGQNPRLLKSGRHDPSFYSNLWSTVLAGKIWKGEIINRRKDGCFYVEEQTITPVKSESGTITHFIAIKQDATERKRLEEALRESESLYQATFNDAPVGIAHTATDGQFLRANRRFCDLLGYTEQELLRRRFQEVTHPEDVAVDLEAIHKLLSGEIQIHRTEKRYVRKDGAVVWGNRTASMQRDISGQPKSFIVVFQDVTERKQAEERLAREKHFFETAIDGLPGILYLFDHQGRILRWNRNFEQVSGYTSEEISRMRPWDFFSNGERELISQRIAEVLEKGQSSVEAGLLSKDGRKTPYFFTGARVVRDEMPCVIGMGIDLSEQKKLEAQFLRTQRLESIGTLASGIAHDLNNILAPILMAEQILRMKPQDRDSAGLLDTIAASAQRGAEVVKQVLTFARGVEGERALLQPRHLVHEMEKIVRETFPRAITVKTNLSKDLWPVIGDATQLHQVLLNLCVNARDAMPDGGTLLLAASNVELDEDRARAAEHGASPKPGPFAVLEVGDTGAGIPAKIVDKIFDPFFTTKEQGKGTGLGLSTVVGIVKSHGGWVNVSSEVGKGTTFRIFLPATPDGKATAADNGEALLPVGRGELVLVVDDEAEIREVTRSILTKHGYEVLVASDGTEAVALVAQLPGKIKLVLTDIMMPFMDGVALIRAVKKLDSRIKFIASSGLEQSERSAELRNLSVKTLLVKPYTARKLLIAFDELLHPPPV